MFIVCLCVAFAFLFLWCKMPRINDGVVPVSVIRGACRRIDLPHGVVVVYVVISITWIIVSCFVGVATGRCWGFVVVVFGCGWGCC